MASRTKNWNDALVGGTLKRVVIKPRWWMYWSPKAHRAHRAARNATTVLRYTGEQKQNKALKKILKKA